MSNISETTPPCDSSVPAVSVVPMATVIEETEITDGENVNNQFSRNCSVEDDMQEGTILR